MEQYRPFPEFCYANNKQSSELRLDGSFCVREPMFLRALADNKCEDLAGLLEMMTVLGVDPKKLECWYKDETIQLVTNDILVPDLMNCNPDVVKLVLSHFGSMEINVVVRETSDAAHVSTLLRTLGWFGKVVRVRLVSADGTHRDTLYVPLRPHRMHIFERTSARV